MAGRNGGKPSPLVAWSSVAILLLLMLLSILDRQIIALQIGPIKRDLALSDTQIGLLQGFAFGILYAVAGLPIGWAVDRVSRRWIAYLGVTLWSLSAAACGLAGNFWQLYLGRTFVGIGEASINPVSVSLIGDLFPRDKLGAPMGVYSAGYYLGSGVALASGGLVVALFAQATSISFPVLGHVAPWQAVFLCTGLPGIPLALLAFLLRDSRPTASLVQSPDGREDTLLRYLAKRPRMFFHMFIGFGLGSFTAYAIAAWTPAYLERVHGLSVVQVGLTWGAVVAIAGAIGAFGGGFLIDRVERAGVRHANVVVPGISVLLSWPFLAGAYFMPVAWVTLAMLAVGMMLFGVTAPGSYATWVKMGPPAMRGQLTAGFTLITGFLGGGFGPVAVGLVTDHIVRHEAGVGTSIAITVSISLPLTAILLLTGRNTLDPLSPSAS